MGAPSNSEIDAWLREGGLVVTASDRAARALAAAFDRARRAEGLTAWEAPRVRDWNSFVRAAWEGYATTAGDSRTVLNAAQEQSLWAAIEGSRDPGLSTLLERPRHRLAAMAIEAHGLLCAYAPRFLNPSARTGWALDAATFAGWLTAFDAQCHADALVSTQRLANELVPLLDRDSSARPPLRLAGFDRILPAQRAVFDAWGACREFAPTQSAARVSFYAAVDQEGELNACALWCRDRLAAHPHKRLLVITRQASQLRGEIERTFRRHLGPDGQSLFEFSLGIPLSQVALVRGAGLLLRWLGGSLAEHELDWLLSTGLLSATEEEASALRAWMRALRRKGRQRPDWTLNAFTRPTGSDNILPPAWVERMAAARQRLDRMARSPQSPLEWAGVVSELLEAAGWPGARSLASAEFQALRRWRQALDTCASLGFDGRRIAWNEFLALLDRTLDDTLFAPESNDAPILIAGPAESAGLEADAIWFLGANEEGWPASASIHPLLPPHVQREAGMPHATPQLDWDLAQAMTRRLLTSAQDVHFSYARQSKGVEARPSRLVLQLAGAPRALPAEWIAPPQPPAKTVFVEDTSRTPYRAATIAGGAAVLTAQSQCPFKAFAIARLGAARWEPAEASLTPAQRGKLLHDVLHRVWAGPPDNPRTRLDLQKIEDINLFISNHIRYIIQQKLPVDLVERLPRRYLELEEMRLVRLIAHWLDFEASRLDFEVVATEVDKSISVAGLGIDLRLDRVDRLIDDSRLVVDYKTGYVSPNSWDLPRPDDVQLPLYAGFALGDEVLGGLVFARVRTGKPEFAGRVGNASETLLRDPGGASSLVKKPLTLELLLDWRDYIEGLARAFVAGRAEVDPRDYPATCAQCGLQTLCRINEARNADCDDEDESTGEAYE